jgi:hypothetical protein
MWLLFPQLARHNIRPAQRRRSTRLVEYALARQRPELNIVKREKWTEADVDALPAEEPDMFERKSASSACLAALVARGPISSVLVW